MWSPKTPLKLPGKKPASSFKYDFYNMYYLNEQETEINDINGINQTN